MPPLPPPGRPGWFVPGPPGAGPPGVPGTVPPVARSLASATAAAPSCTGAATAFVPVTVTPQSWVSVDRTVMTTVPSTGPSSGIFFTSATTALAIVAPVM
ncbi:MAG: hypothetical protein LC635_01215 [Pseudonocardiaceae bacterium]|nr:hypothetical protein [Pseudonocardiaceae bacterium]